jgi:hypothetical protein
VTHHTTGLSQLRAVFFFGFFFEHHHHECRLAIDDVISPIDDRLSVIRLDDRMP